MLIHLPSRTNRSANTQWPVATKDVQSALALIGSWARTDTGLPAASPTVAGIIRTATQAEVEAGTVGTVTNTQWPVAIKDVQSALELIGSWARTDTGLPVASPTVAGVIRTATQAEVDAGTISNC
ncbi:hypothetical protein vBKpnAMK6_00460 [Klebsiella phage vB_Kpn_AM_K6]